MRRGDVIDLLLRHRDQLAQLGVAHLALIGSVARDHADAFSDVDIVMDTLTGEAPGLFALARIKDQLVEILGCSVDLISRRGLDHAERLKHRVAPEIVEIF
jgi:predicted nucleotidyltransferase